MANETTVTTMTECIPTIVAAALLELDEGNVIQPLVTEVPFPGPGYVHQTPFIRRLLAETTDDLTAQAMDSGSYDEVSPSAATVGAHGAYVEIKDLTALATVVDMAAVAGQLIGQCLTVRKEIDLLSLFSSFTTNQGQATSVAMAPADLYDAYGSLRNGHAPLPYNLVLNPGQIWNVNGLISLFDNSTDAISGGAGVGTVAEDFARYGFAGMAMGFSLWADANIPFTTTANGIGAAFSREAIKNVTKRGLFIELQRFSEDVADKIVGSELRGEAILRNKHGNQMQFPVGKTT